jgi:hypothetical protein
MERQAQLRPHAARQICGDAWIQQEADVAVLTYLRSKVVI